jgi:1-acylglycerone phosphate reductase
VVTGFVQSNILRSGLQVAPGSLYTAIKYHIENLKVQGNERGMPASEYARRVLDQIMRETPPSELWEGAGARSIRLITSWLQLWLSVSTLSPLPLQPGVDESQEKIWYRKFELRKL